MIRSLATHGLRQRSLAALSHRTAQAGIRLSPYASVNVCARRTEVLQAWTRAASTSTSSHTTPSTPPPSSEMARKKVDLHPKPIKPVSSNKSADAKPTPSPLRVVTPAETPKTESEVVAKAVEQMSTVQMMKYDVQDAIKRGIMSAPPRDASSLASFWHQMKEVFKFYWRGIKQINANRVAVSDIRQRARESGAPLTRAETRFIRLFYQDALKLVPFVLIALVLEEIIPLLVLYAPWMLPSTCVMPSQAERIRRKHRESQNVFSALRDQFDEVRMIGVEKGFAPLSEVKGVGLQALCGILGLSTFGPPPIRRSRLTSTLKYLAADDAQLRAENMGALLSEDELSQALHERGIMTDTLPRTEWEPKLKWWLATADADGVGGDAISRRVQLVATAAARRW